MSAESIEDEGMQIIESARKYLDKQYRAVPDEDEQRLCAFEDADEILYDRYRRIEDEYSCQQCGRPVKRGQTWCSPRCYHAWEL